MCIRDRSWHGKNSIGQDVSSGMYFYQLTVGEKSFQKKLEFFKKVALLSPFGSGNPEPKFIIENVKTINGKIVGEKHVKSVLIGPEGTSIKTIAFNATESELEAYLLKKNSNIRCWIKNIAIF